MLLVEHDAAVAELARRYLEREGLTVRVAGAPADAAAALGVCRPAVVVLDLTMPGLTSAGVRRRIAPRGHVGPPELICLEGPGGLRPQHVGVAEDAGSRCLARPFSPRVLVARVQAAMRQPHGSDTGGATGAPGRTVTSGELTLDTAARRVTAAGTGISLTATEFALLAFLVGNAGRVFTREQLLGSVWGAAATAGARTVDLYVAQLRAKLGAHSPIRTVRGVGYAARA